jgi:hypothetical protein
MKTGKSGVLQTAQFNSLYSKELKNTTPPPPPPPTYSVVFPETGHTTPYIAYSPLFFAGDPSGPRPEGPRMVFLTATRTNAKQQIRGCSRLFLIYGNERRFSQNFSFWEASLNFAVLQG